VERLRFLHQMRAPGNTGQHWNVALQFRAGGAPPDNAASIDGTLIRLKAE
jgi:hypothetical protein